MLLLVWNYNNTHCHRHYHRLLLLERAVELRATEKGGQRVTCPSRFFDRFRNKLFFFKRPFRPTRFSELPTAPKLLLVLAQNASLTPARRHKCQFGCGVSIFSSKISKILDLCIGKYQKTVDQNHILFSQKLSEYFRELFLFKNITSGEQLLRHFLITLIFETLSLAATTICLFKKCNDLLQHTYLFWPKI